MFAFQLPKHIVTFPEAESPSQIEFNDHNATAMKYQYENPRLFRGRRDHSTWGISDSYIEAPEPLSNIFYLLQCMMPGILTITREDDPDDMPEFINSRGLPQPQCLEKHRPILEQIFGEHGYADLLEAAGDLQRAYCCESVPR